MTTSKCGMSQAYRSAGSSESRSEGVLRARTTKKTATPIAARMPMMEIVQIQMDADESPSAGAASSEHGAADDDASEPTEKQYWPSVACPSLETTRQITWNCPVASSDASGWTTIA